MTAKTDSPAALPYPGWLGKQQSIFD